MSLQVYCWTTLLFICCKVIFHVGRGETCLLLPSLPPLLSSRLLLLYLTGHQQEGPTIRNNQNHNLTILELKTLVVNPPFSLRPRISVWFGPCAALQVLIGIRWCGVCLSLVQTRSACPCFHLVSELFFFYSICKLFNIKQVQQALKVDHKGNIFIASQPPVVRLSLRGLLRIRAESCALSREGIGCHCNKWIPQCLRGKWKRFSLSGSEQPGVTVASPGCHPQPISLYKGWWIRAGGGGKASANTKDEGHKNDKANSIGALISDGEGGQEEEPEIFKRAFSRPHGSLTGKSFLAWGDAPFCCWRYRPRNNRVKS